jgi:hypothetical protein
MRTVNIKSLKSDKFGKPYIALASNITSKGVKALYNNEQMTIDEGVKPLYQKEILKDGYKTISINFYRWKPDNTLFKDL